jgi:hypothetical protein
LYFHTSNSLFLSICKCARKSLSFVLLPLFTGSRVTAQQLIRSFQLRTANEEFGQRLQVISEYIALRRLASEAVLDSEEDALEEEIVTVGGEVLRCVSMPPWDER